MVIYYLVILYIPKIEDERAMVCVTFSMEGHAAIERFRLFATTCSKLERKYSEKLSLPDVGFVQQLAYTTTPV